MLDDVADNLMSALEHAWHDRPGRARRLARKFAAGTPVIVPAWIGEQQDAPAIPGRAHLRPGSQTIEWRPQDRQRNARNLVLLEPVGPATIRAGEKKRPFAHAWRVRYNTEGTAFLFIDRPYAAEFGPLLTPEHL